MSLPIIQLHDVVFNYPGEKQPLLDGLNLTIHEGQKIGIWGPNGCGKSTLTKLILGLFSPQKGSISLFGQKIRWRHHHPSIGYIGDPGYSTEQMGLPHDWTVQEMLEVIQQLYPSSKADREKLIENLGLTTFLHRRVDQLSKGQRKRLMATLTFLRKPQILLLDEPLDGLDQVTSSFIMNLLTQFYQNSTNTLLLISHDLGEIDTLTDDVWAFNEQKLIKSPSPKFKLSTCIQGRDNQEVELKMGIVKNRFSELLKDSLQSKESVNLTINAL